VATVPESYTGRFLAEVLPVRATSARRARRPRAAAAA
jgi:hypothetical protein